MFTQMYTNVSQFFSDVKSLSMPQAREVSLANHLVCHFAQPVPHMFWRVNVKVLPLEEIVSNMQHVECFLTHNAIFSVCTGHEHSGNIFKPEDMCRVFISGTLSGIKAMLVRRHQTCWVFESIARRAKNLPKTWPYTWKTSQSQVKWQAYWWAIFCVGFPFFS